MTSTPHHCGTRDASQNRLSLPQRFFRSLAIFDIRARSVPLKDVSLLVEQWHGADQEPAIFPVSATQTHFILGCFTGSHIPVPSLHDPWKVFGMNCACRVCKRFL